MKKLAKPKRLPAPVGAKPGKKRLPAPLGAKRGKKRLPPALVRDDVDHAPDVLNRLHEVILQRRTASPEVSHSARLLSRGVAKVAQKFGEEAVECLIEAVAGNADALVSESADVLYHMLVLWAAAGVQPADVWAELERREGVSGIAEKASRVRALGVMTTKIP